jgi:hypothetical protein
MSDICGQLEILTEWRAFAVSTIKLFMVGIIRDQICYFVNGLEGLKIP